MGMGMYFLQVTKEQLDVIEEDEEMYYEISQSDEADEISFGFDSEFDAVNFLLNDNAFRNDSAKSPNYLEAAQELEDIFESYLNVTSVKYIAQSFKSFTEDDLKRRFLSDSFKKALFSEYDDKIYCGGSFGDEEYFKQLWSAVSALSNYFIEAAKQEKGMLFWLV